jgi:hypothetical protein
MRVAKKRRNTITTAVPLRIQMDRPQPSTTPRSKSTNAAARSHRGRLASQGTPGFSHGSRLLEKGDYLLDVTPKVDTQTDD